MSRAAVGGFIAHMRNALSEMLNDAEKDLQRFDVKPCCEVVVPAQVFIQAAVEQRDTARRQS
ncbi:hypothetical protein UP10_07020 [Bradyrhizobium sp. LTSPM299]|nr:hypothetical protein UP10_07020 [Bradyrhizobium sp. LTSPM299]